MSNIKILVACHKPDVCRHDVVFTPIHVGRDISKNTDEMSDFIGDNTGDNISSLNPYYCELTAQYWMWKNLKNVDIVGLAHYRRYLKGQIQKKISSVYLEMLILLWQIDCMKDFQWPIK